MRRHNYFYPFLALILLYLVAVVMAPIEPGVLARYGLSEVSFHLLAITIVIPRVLIWLVAFYGFSKFRTYAKTIEAVKEGAAAQAISRGLFWLAFSLPLQGLTGLLVEYAHDSQLDQEILVIALNHTVRLALPLLAFIFISNGAAMLAKQTRRKTDQIDDPRRWVLGLIVLATVFGWAVFTLTGDTHNAGNIYLLPDWFIIAFVVVPYLYMWFRGGMAIYHINFYRHYVKGYVYRQVIGYLAAGLTLVILLSVISQFLAVMSPRLEELDFTPTLLIGYLLILLSGCGYGLIALGARKLAKFEEV